MPVESESVVAAVTDASQICRLPNIERILAGIVRIELLAIRSDMPSIRQVDTSIHFINRKIKPRLHKLTYAMQCADKN
jgi:hypothetical protein